MKRSIIVVVVFSMHATCTLYPQYPIHNHPILIDPMAQCKRHPSADFLGVLLLAHQFSRLLLITDLEQPGLVRLLVHHSRVVLHLQVGDRYLPSDRRVHVSRNLDTLDDQHPLPCLDVLADCRKLDVDDFSELVLGMICDANTSNVFPGDEFDPLVAFSVEFSCMERVILAKQRRSSPIDLSILSSTEL